MELEKLGFIEQHPSIWIQGAVLVVCGRDSRTLMVFDNESDAAEHGHECNQDSRSKEEDFDYSMDPTFITDIEDGQLHAVVTAFSAFELTTTP